MADTSRRWVLRDLPFAARLVLAAFLITVGIGYLSALVQLHFQHATPGSVMPTAADAERVFSGKQGRPVSVMESLIDADENLPFGGNGQMRAAFTKHSDGWKEAIKDLVKNKHMDEAQAEAEIKKPREGERLALLDWLRSGASKDAYKKDSFALSAEVAGRPITDEYVLRGDDGKPPAVKLKKMLDDRCVRCHQKDGADPHAADYPLDTWERLKPYVQAADTGAMSLTKLAQTTHVHLLGFAVLYGFTGLIFAFSSYPGFLRVLIAPLPLVAQVADISCWWLARENPLFAHAIVYTGGIVGAGLLLQIVLGLFNLFGKVGKLVLLVLLIAAAYGGYQLKETRIDPFLIQEKNTAAKEN
jgi:hypothetical protein